MVYMREFDPAIHFNLLLFTGKAKGFRFYRGYAAVFKRNPWYGGKPSVFMGTRKNIVKSTIAPFSDTISKIIPRTCLDWFPCRVHRKACTAVRSP